MRYNWQQDGDAGWKGINKITDPGSVPPGYLIRSENKRLRDGSASTRPGTTQPSDFNPEFENQIIGSGIYSNPEGAEVMLVATLDETYVWALQYGKDPYKIDLSVGNTGTNPVGLVTFVQAFEKVLLLRFPLQVPLIWDGDPANTFNPVNPAPTPHTGIPMVTHGQPFQNRLLLYRPYSAPVPWRDQFIATDVIDPIQYDDALNTFRVNAGESDVITCIQPYFKGQVIVFMQDSIHMVSNFTIDPFKTEQRLLNNRLGSVSVNLPFMDGADIIFLSKSGAGFYRLSEIITEEISALPRPVSWTIQSDIDRINWDGALLWSGSEGLGDYAFFSAPLDNFTGGCNAIFVYNTVTREFESLDTWDDPLFRINAMHVTTYNLEQRLFALDYQARRIYVMYEGISDNINGQEINVKDRMATRGYVVSDPAGFKRFHRAKIGVRTYSPRAVVSARMDGFNEISELGVIQKNRTRYYQFDRNDYAVLTDDADAPKREDYSVTENNNAIDDFESLPEGPLAILPGTPLTFTGKKQQSIEAYQVRENGRWCSIEIDNVQGQCDVLGVSVEASPVQDGITVLA